MSNAPAFLEFIKISIPLTCNNTITGPSICQRGKHRYTFYCRAHNGFFFYVFLSFLLRWIAFQIRWTFWNGFAFSNWSTEKKTLETKLGYRYQMNNIFFSVLPSLSISVYSAHKPTQTKNARKKLNFENEWKKTNQMRRESMSRSRRRRRKKLVWFEFSHFHCLFCLQCGRKRSWKP